MEFEGPHARNVRVLRFGGGSRERAAALAVWTAGFVPHKDSRR